MLRALDEWWPDALDHAEGIQALRDTGSALRAPPQQVGRIRQGIHRFDLAVAARGTGEEGRSGRFKLPFPTYP